MHRKVYFAIVLVSLLIIPQFSYAQQISSLQDNTKKPNLSENLKFMPKINKIDSKLHIQKNYAQPIDKQKTIQTNLTNMERVIVITNVTDTSLLDFLKREEATIEATYDNYIQISIPNDKLDIISQHNAIKKITHADGPIHTLTSEGTSVIDSITVNNRGNTGSGVNVAVIDTGFDISNPEISGNVAGYRSFCTPNDISGGGDSSHGTAVAEIIVDVAPDVNLYLYNACTSVEFFNLVDHIIGRGDIDIVSMSLSWFGHGARDGTNLYAQKVNQAKNSGILWVNAAGNYAIKHWQGTFSDSDLDDFHNFLETDETINISATVGQKIRLELTWDETWGSSSQDYDLYLYNPSLSIVASSSTVQNGNDDPYEFISYTVPTSGTYHIVIEKYSATQNNFLQLLSYDINLSEYAVSAGSISRPGDATGSFTVGAVNYSTLLLESFSSRGPTADGRIKPDVVGPDGVTTSTLNPFFGTSAATPYVAGTAALLKYAYPSSSVDQLRSALEQNTSNFHSKNNNDGTGLVNADNAESVCIPTLTGDWNLNVNCTLSSNHNAPGNVIIDGNSVLTIPAGVILNIDFINFKLLIKSGSGVLIKNGGALD
ncbi:exported hypothetical protein [Candidatus Nitrosotenuis uzonensis]|uniref:Peptidase S8/S53 domain-containing protein n=2 Tax=Candidatus Nitrosotenuis uzonensis TaxID=1407055 RepID=A0A812ETU7_9ARCH|nr:exported hypothetical protein [Candidatus Nitrosotenuis uzonensis]